MSAMSASSQSHFHVSARESGSSTRIAKTRNDNGLAAGDEVEFDHIGDGTLNLRRERADDAKRPATGYGARPSWAISPRRSKYMCTSVISLPSTLDVTQ